MYLNLSLLNRVGSLSSTKVATPKISPVGGIYSTVIITCATPGATIYYTIDGSTPSALSFEYTAPVVMEDDATIKAIGIKAGLTDSNIRTFYYTFGPTVDPPDGYCWVIDEGGDYVVDGEGEFVYSECETDGYTTAWNGRYADDWGSAYTENWE